MPEVVTVREDQGIIEVRSYDEVSERDLTVSRDRVAEIIREKGIKEILVDARDLTSLPPTFALFLFGKSFADDEALRTVKLAAVVSEKTTKDMSFIETVVRNRGVAMRIFESMEAAISWLKE
jgi:hypothetical protein